MWSRRWRCQRASVQEAPFYFLNWTWAEQSEASDVKLSDYQELHSGDWHHYTDCVPSRLILQSHTRHISAKWLIVPQRHEVCVCVWVCMRVCVCPWAHGCWRGRISCSQMLQDAAPTESPVWPGRIRKTAFTTVLVSGILNFQFHAKRREKQHLSKQIFFNNTFQRQLN